MNSTSLRKAHNDKYSSIRIYDPQLTDENYRALGGVERVLCILTGNNQKVFIITA